MRFIWFNLMAWPHLPEEFREKYRSVWVDIPSSLYDPVRGHEVYNDYLDQLEFAETVGFDGLGVNEHHANAYGLMPSPCSAARSRCTNLRSGSPRNSRCLTCYRAAGSSPAFRLVLRWTPTTPTVACRRRCASAMPRRTI